MAERGQAPNPRGGSCKEAVIDARCAGSHWTFMAPTNVRVDKLANDIVSNSGVE